MNVLAGADTPSDWLLIACLAPMLYFGFRFTTGRPRTWFRDPLGWVIILFNLSVLALLTLIVYGIVFGQPVGESWRLCVASAVFLSGCGKAIMLERERYRGRLTIPVYEHSGKYTGRNPMVKGDRHS